MQHVTKQKKVWQTVIGLVVTNVQGGITTGACDLKPYHRKKSFAQCALEAVRGGNKVYFCNDR